MKRNTRHLAFRALAPDTGAGGGAPGAPAEAQSPRDIADATFTSAALDAAYEAANAEDGAPSEGEPAKEDAVADAAASETDTKPTGDDTPPDPASQAETDPKPSALDAVPPDVADKYPAVKAFADIQAGLDDPTTAPQVLRWFAETVATGHGTTVEQMLGLAPAPTAAPNDLAPAEPDWKGLGFASREDYDAAPDHEQAGYETPGEFRLAKRLDEVMSLVKPLADDRAATAKTAAETAARTNWEGAIAKIAPTSIQAVKAETGWEATPAQALEAARALPELASRPGGLREAIVQHHARTIITAARASAPAAKPVPPEMPNGAAPQGDRLPDPLDTDWDGYFAAVSSRN